MWYGVVWRLVTVILCGTEAGDWYCVLWRLMTVVLHGMEAREFGALWYGGW